MKVSRVDFSPSDWLTGTIRLTNEQRGVYITICALLYDKGGPVSREDIVGMCRGNRRSIDRVIDELVAAEKIEIAEDGQISQKRCVKELKNAQKRIEIALKNGQSGGREKIGIAKVCPNIPQTLAKVCPNIPQTLAKNPQTLGPKPSNNNHIEEPAGLSSAKLTTNTNIKERRVRARAREGEPPADRGYVFDGRVIRLTQRDFDQWRSAFSAIPDLHAELRAIDDKLVEQNHEGKWFALVSGWLRSKHERLIKDAAAPPALSWAESQFAQWRYRVKRFVDDPKSWLGEWGWPPGDPACHVPPDILVEFGFEPPNDRGLLNYVRA